MNGKVVNCPHCGKILSPDVWQEKTPLPRKPKCCRCGCPRVWKAGHVNTESGKVQRYECKQCGYQASVMAGRVMHRSKMPLRAWFNAAYLGLPL